jgi:hypothetical protein
MTSEAAKKSWRTRHIENCTFHKIVVLRKDNTWDRHKAWFGDDPMGAVVFMWGRSGLDYQLYINGREYGWPKTMGEKSLKPHIEYCIKFDESFYRKPNTHFPSNILSSES